MHHAPPDKGAAPPTSWSKVILATVVASCFAVLFYKVYLDPPSCPCHEHHQGGPEPAYQPGHARSRRATAAELESMISDLQKQIDNIHLIPGPPGPPGPRGLDGMDGKQGLRGERGPVGKQGPRGYNGKDGNDGANGYCAVWNPSSGQSEVPCADTTDAADSESVEKLKGVVNALVRNAVIGQVSSEQRVRYEGSSGITQTRAYNGGSKAYHEATFVNIAFANFHNHADFKYTVGMGEIAAVLNGVEFWTRHNDYSLRQPHSTSTDYHATQELELPAVPPEVTARGSVSEQAEEMRRWFHAWQDQDPLCPSCQKLDDEREAKGMPRFDAPGTERHYINYFKPILCYLEGAWILDATDIEEPFESERHFIDAKTWRELYDKNRFLYMSGRKSTAENLPYLPMSFRETVGNGSEPLIAHWEYRIVCHRLKDNIPLDRFRVDSDLSVQMRGSGGQPLTLSELEQSRMARFDLNSRNMSRWYEGSIRYQYIDALMEEIPGKDNYAGRLFDDAFGINVTHHETGELLNTAYYSRYYKVAQNDAMGRQSQRRSFSDGQMWAAMTSQDKVAGVTACTSELIADIPGSEVCTLEKTKAQKWTWAIPIEIIYLTPLSEWNPYNIEDCPQSDSQAACKHVSASATPGGPARNGGLTPDKAYNGVSRNKYFITPTEFYSDDDNIEVDAADTSGGVVGVLDQEGNVRRVRAAGHWIFFPQIQGFDKPIRQRYPIMPTHVAGSNNWKELKALQTITIEGTAFEDINLQNSLSAVREDRYGVTLVLGASTHSGIAQHVHTVQLSGEDLATIDEMGSVRVTTSLAAGHTHDMYVTRTRLIDSDGVYSYKYELVKCFDAVNEPTHTCGLDPAVYPVKVDNRTELVNKLAPFALYTDLANTYVDGVWRDSSGNSRDSAQADENKRPYLDMFEPAAPVLRFRRANRLDFAANTVPTDFTIFVRARYSGKYSYRIANAVENGNWYLGWDNGNVGATRFNDWKTSSSETTSPKNAFYVMTGRNSNEEPTVWRNGNPISNAGAVGGASGYTLSINTRSQSDLEITDVVVFDRHLSDEEVSTVNTILESIPAPPAACCWDGHTGVTKQENNS